jgi:hypothetical protein
MPSKPAPVTAIDSPSSVNSVRLARTSGTKRKHLKHFDYSNGPDCGLKSGLESFGSWYGRRYLPTATDSKTGGIRNASRFPHKILCMEKVVRIFQSFEKADEADLRDRLAMTPEERVEVFLGIQQRTFRNAADERLARVYRVLTLEQS